MDESLERELEQFVTHQTGLAVDRVARIVRLGEPWPIAKLFSDVDARVRQDAEAANVEEWKVYDAYLALAKMGGDPPLSRDAIESHFLRTLALAGEEPEAVQAVDSAMLTFYRQHFTKMEEICREIQNKMTDEGTTR
jgi:hypothetical protein